MHHSLRLVLAGVAICGAGFVLGADAPTPEAQKAPPAQRQLLQPPKMAIASPITDRFALRGLFYMPDISTQVRYDNSAGVPGTLVTAEDTLGFKSQLKQASVDMMFRIGERHRIRADFYKMTRSGDRVINQQIRFGEDVYDANDRVVSTMDLRKLGLNYSYSVVRTERFELAAGMALHLLQLEGVLEVPAEFQREKLDAAGPYPSLTADITWRITRRFSLNASGSYLDYASGDIAASHIAWHGDVQFRVRPNLALGVGYTQTRFKVDSTNTDFLGFFDLKYKGPEAFFRVSF